MHTLTRVYVTIRMDDAFTLNCRPTVPVGCEERVVDATRPLLPLVKGLAPRLVGQYIDRCIIRGKTKNCFVDYQNALIVSVLGPVYLMYRQEFKME